MVLFEQHIVFSMFINETNENMLLNKYSITSGLKFEKIHHSHGHCIV
jgi:hypothetical protein